MLVNEIFYSLQGEGHWTGTPMIFIRLSGCNMACDFCDTQHQEGTEMSTMDIINTLNQYPVKTVCITGGEPCIHSLQELLSAFDCYKYATHLETNGTIYQGCLMNVDWLTVSPKKDIKHIPNDILQLADEIKIVISNTIDELLMNAYIWNCNAGTRFFVQPESGREDSTKLCVDWCKENPKWRLSLQIQKLIDIR